MDERAKKVVEELERLATGAGYASMSGFGNVYQGGRFEALLEAARIVSEAFETEEGENETLAQ